MNIQDLKSKFKNIIDISVDFVLNNKRYFLGGCIFILMAVLVFVGTSPKNSNGKDTSGVYKAYKVNKNKELDTLINNYYTAYANGDVDTLQTICTPYCDRELDYIKYFSDYIDSYKDVTIYTKPGLKDGEYLVTTEFSFVFVDIDTPAPGLGFFYVQTNEDGKLYINNAFCTYNEDNNGEAYERDPDIYNLYVLLANQQDLLDKRSETEKKFNEALANDAQLNTFINETLKLGIQEWSKEYEAKVAAEAEAQAQAEQEAAEAAAAEAEAQAQAEEEANAYTGTVSKKVNVRASADKDSDKLGSLEKGTTITIYAEEGDFYKFDYNGTRAYVAKEFVKVNSNEETTEETTEEEETTTTTAGSIAAGTEITLQSTTNIRSQMDQSSSKVAVAYAGEKVTVVMSYAEGWTKVKYGKKEGYIRTDLLQQQQ